MDTLGVSLNFFDHAKGRNEQHATLGPLRFVVEEESGELIIGIGCHVERIDRAGNKLQVAHHNGCYTADFAERLPQLRLPVQILWAADDEYFAPRII